jgi:hypothetical protein
MVTNFDGSVESTQALTSATQQYYAAQVQLLAQLEQVRRGITGSGGSIDSAVRGIQMSGLDSSGKYEFLRLETERLREELQTATNPQDVQRISSQITANTTEAFGLLSPEQQQAQAGTFVDNLRTYGKEVDARITALQAKAEKDAAKQITDVRDVMRENIDKWKEAANISKEAADTQLVAAQTPIQIEVTVDDARIPDGNSG